MKIWKRNILIDPRSRRIAITCVTTIIVFLSFLCKSRLNNRMITAGEIISGGIDEGIRQIGWISQPTIIIILIIIILLRGSLSRLKIRNDEMIDGEYSIALAECVMIGLFEFLITRKSARTTKASGIKFILRAYETHNKASVISRGHKWRMISQHASIPRAKMRIYGVLLYFLNTHYISWDGSFWTVFCYLSWRFSRKPSSRPP